MGMGSGSIWCTMSFSSLINKYKQLQSQVMSQVKMVASRVSTATPGQFLLLQFSMSQVTQIGESITNIISTVQSMINYSVRNQKSS